MLITGVVAELLQKTFEVKLITRPSRFGKTLVMDMMANFFDIRSVLMRMMPF